MKKRVVKCLQEISSHKNETSSLSVRKFPASMRKEHKTNLDLMRKIEEMNESSLMGSSYNSSEFCGADCALSIEWNQSIEFILACAF